MNRMIRRLAAASVIVTLCLSIVACSDSTTAEEEGAEGVSLHDTTDVLATSPDSLEAMMSAIDSVRATVPISDTLSASSVERLSDAIASLASSIQLYTTRTTDPISLSDVTIGDAGEAVQHYGMRVFWTIFVLVLTYFFVRGLTFVLDKISEIRAGKRLFYKRLVPILRVLIWSITLYFIIRVIFRVDTQSLIAAAAAIGVAIGFAAQDIVKNIFGGFVIISDRPFQVGDKISVGGTYGEVTAIGLRSTRIVTPDDSVVTVPNAQVMTAQISNANAGELDCQVVTDLYLPGWIDEIAAKKIAYEAASSSKYVYLKKPIVVLVKDEFKETFITHIKVKAYVLDTRYEFLLMSDITERARQAFREAGLLRHMHGAKAYVDLTSMGYETKDTNGGGPDLPKPEDPRHPSDPSFFRAEENPD